MRIDGITTCCGPLYAGYLERTLDAWRWTLDSLTVVFRLSDPSDPKIKTWGGGAELHFVHTDAFNTKGAHFNKGAALNEGLFSVFCRPNVDWLLSFDCDILPLPNWRRIVEPQISPGELYGARRYTPQGKPEDGRFYPRGYFQLWHASDPTYRRNPIFDDWHKHAGHYDTSFAEQWPADKQVDLGLKLIHLGEKSKHWYGPGADPELMEEAKREWRENRRKSTSDMT